MEIEAEGMISKLEIGLTALDVVDYKVMPSWTNEVVDNLAFIQAILMDPPKQFVEDGRLGKLESLACEIGSIISYFDLKDMDKDMARKLCAQLINHPLGLWVYEVESIYLKERKPLLIDFPKTSHLNVVDQLLKNLEHQVEVKSDSLGPLKHFILQLQRKIQPLSFCLTQILQLPAAMMTADHKDSMESITRLIFEAEYVIYSFSVGDIPMWCCMFWLYDMLKVLDEIQEDMCSQDDMYSIDAQSIISTVLSNVERDLNIIPIVSLTDISEQIMEVFDSYPIVLAFDIQTWGSALSYKERKIEVLHELLDNVSYLEGDNGHVEEEHSIDTSEDQLEKLVQKLVKNKKYLIILEDVKDIDAFKDIRRVLPNDRNGSIVLLTTHSQQLAFQCRSGSSTSQANYSTTTNEGMMGFKRMLESLESLIGGNHSSTLQTDKPETTIHDGVVDLRRVLESVDSVGQGNSEEGGSRVDDGNFKVSDFFELDDLIFDEDPIPVIDGYPRKIPKYALMNEAVCSSKNSSYHEGRSRDSTGISIKGSQEKRVVSRTMSQVEILDDGFKWRKYGKKMVQNSPHPRNYYRCSVEGCSVKKRVEKDKDDPRYVITTYVGIHNHPGPSQI